MTWVHWLIIAGFFFILECITVGFMVFWIGVGALLALATSFITQSIIIQLTVFVLSSVLLIIFTKPLVDKYIIPKDVKTNSESLVGKHGIVTKDILQNENGQVKIGSEIWTARSESGEEITKDNNVEILRVEGVKVIVKKSI